MISALFTVVAFQGDLSNLTLTEFQSKLGAARGSFGAAPTLGRKGEELEKDPYYYKIEMFSRAVFIFPAGVSTRRYLYRPGRSLALMENVGGKLRKVWHADVCTSATEPRIKGTGTLAKFIGLDDTFKKGKFSKSVQKSLDSVQAFALYNYQGSATNRGVFIKPDGSISMDFTDAWCHNFWAGDPYPVCPEEWEWVRAHRHG